jgi:maltooligosyltrehalose synthase
VWNDTRIELPDPNDPVYARRFRNILTGATIEPAGGALPAASVLERFPIALLVPCST